MLKTVTTSYHSVA